MIFPNADTWKNWGITKECHKFFIIRWQEILSEETFNTWQIKSSNIISLITELIEVATVVKEVPETHINIQVIINEIKDNLITEVVIKEHFPFTNKYIEIIESIYKNQFGCNGGRSIDKLIRVSKVLISNLKDYEIKLTGKISFILMKTPNSYKIELNQLLMSFAITLYKKGYSIKSLQESINILIQNSEIDFEKRFDLLVKKYNGIDRDYECSFFVNWAGKPEKLQFKEVKINSQRVKSPTEEEKKFYSQNKQSLIATIKVKTKDKYTARRISEEKIESFSAMSQLYLVDKISAIRSELCLVTDDKSVQNCIESDNTFLNSQGKVRNSETSIQQLIDLCEKLEQRDYDQLHSSLQYHKLALQSNSDELRLVNLWIALESLFMGDDGSIIKKILHFVPKLNTNVYVYYQLRALAISMNKLWKESDISEILEDLTKSNKYKLDAFDLLRIMLSEENTPLLKKFKKIISMNPLLIFRCERYWSETFRTPVKLVNYLEKHRERVEWQIQRIYRTRNLIVHKGHNLEGSRLLIQHLHSYLIISIRTIVNDLIRNPTWNLNDALEHRVLLYDHFIERLKNNNINKLSIEQIFNMEKSLSITGEAVWSDK